MQITVSGKQVDLSDALRTRVSDHLDVIASKYFDHALEAQVTFSRARSFFTCDINVHAGRGLTLRGEGEAADANTRVRRRGRAHRQAAAALSPAGERARARHAPTASGPEAARQYILRQEDEAAAPAGDGDSRRRPTRR